ncbi:hypothetical protein JCM13591A_11540 [Microbacterium xylanilyticum]
MVDVCIAVHAATRPIARVVGSVLDGTAAPVRVTVVAHNIDPAVIGENLGARLDDPRVRLLSLRDGIPSPAGPLNHGLDHADGDFVAVAGSDDEFAPGAIDSWLRVQARTSAEMVIGRVRLANGRTDPYPPVRNGRRLASLDGRKDRLSYRSAPFGIVDRRRFGALRFTPALASGEDIAYSGRIWFSGARIAYDLEGPPYIIHGDAGDRVTHAPRPVAADFGFLDAVDGADWFTALDAPSRTAIVVKYLRMNVMDAIAVRLTDVDGFESHRRPLIGVIERLHRMSPDAFRVLSRADAMLLRAVRDEDTTVERLHALVRARADHRRPEALLTSSPLRLFDRQAPLRTLVAGVRAMSTPQR